MAEEWLDHVVSQYERVRFCQNDLPLIEHLLKAGYTMVAVRDTLKVLRVDSLVKNEPAAPRVAEAQFAWSTNFGE